MNTFTNSTKGSNWSKMQAIKVGNVNLRFAMSKKSNLNVVKSLDLISLFSG